MFVSLASFRALRLSAAITPWLHFEDDIRDMGLSTWEEPIIRRALLADLATVSREERAYFSDMLAEYSEIAARLNPLPPLPPSSPLPQLPPTPPMAPIDFLPQHPPRPTSTVPFDLSDTEPDSDQDTADKATFGDELVAFAAIPDEETKTEPAATTATADEETKAELAAELPSLKRGRDDSDDEETKAEPPKRVRRETRSSKRSGTD